MKEDAPELEQSTQPETVETAPPQDSSQPTVEEMTPPPMSAGATPVHNVTSVHTAPLVDHESQGM